MRFTLEQLERRRPVWIALADLFLDTDVRIWYATTARVLAESPFSSTELTEMFRDEVAPIVEPNLLQVAGEWAGFDEAALIGGIEERLESRWNLPHMHLSGADRDLRAVLLLVERLRTLPDGDRERRWRAWQALRDLFLNGKCPFEETRRVELISLGYKVNELDLIFKAEMMPSYGASIETYNKHNPKLYPDRETVLENWARWRDAFAIE